jgi:hypothetical protein
VLLPAYEARLLPMRYVRDGGNVDIDRSIPPDGGYKFVIVFPTRPSGIQHTESNFDEIQVSRTLPWPSTWELPHASRDGHGAAPTRARPDTVWFFVRTEHLRDRLHRKGGLDVTEAWSKFREEEKKAEQSPPGPAVAVVQGAPVAKKAGHRIEMVQGSATGRT